MTLRSRLESASTMLRASSERLTDLLNKGKGPHAEWIVLLGEIRQINAVVQEAERRAAGVKPDRS